MTDDLMHLADSLGFKTPARQAQTARAVDSVSTSGGPVRPPQVADEPPVTTSIVAADSEGRTGGAGIAPGAVPFTLPPTAAPPSFDDEPLPTWATSGSWTQFFEVNVCGGLDVDEVGPSHCGSYVPHRWHDMTRHGTPIF